MLSAENDLLEALCVRICDWRSFLELQELRQRERRYNISFCQSTYLFRKLVKKDK